MPSTKFNFLPGEFCLKTAIYTLLWYSSSHHEGCNRVFCKLDLPEANRSLLFGSPSFVCVDSISGASQANRGVCSKRYGALPTSLFLPEEISLEAESETQAGCGKRGTQAG